MHHVQNHKQVDVGFFRWLEEDNIYLCKRKLYKEHCKNKALNDEIEELRHQLEEQSMYIEELMKQRQNRGCIMYQKKKFLVILFFIICLVAYLNY